MFTQFSEIVNFFKICFYKKDFSYGIVVVYSLKKEFIFLLIQQKNGNWGFPKGHKKIGETDQEAAKRELYEETGLKSFKLIKDLKYLQKYQYKFLKCFWVKKQLKLFVAFTDNMNTYLSSPEVQSIKWLRYQDALKQLDFKENKETLQKIHKDLKSQ